MNSGRPMLWRVQGQCKPLMPYRLGVILGIEDFIEIHPRIRYRTGWFILVCIQACRLDVLVGCTTLNKDKSRRLISEIGLGFPCLSVLRHTWLKRSRRHNMCNAPAAYGVEGMFLISL